MSIAIELSPTLPSSGVPGAAHAVGIGVFSNRLEAGEVADRLDGAFLESQGFTGKPGQTCVLPGSDGQVVEAPGLGAEADPSVATSRRAAAALARAADKQTHLAIDVLDSVPAGIERPAVAQAVAEGVLLGAYRYTALKSDPEPSHIESLTVVATGGKRVQASLDRGRTVGEAVRIARDLVNQPGGMLTPVAFAARAEELADLRGFRVEVLDREDIEAEKLGGLLGVNRGSDEEPRFLKLSWQAAGKAWGTIALVGKGITFDSGGLSLKPTDGMVGMKGDMAGAAAVLATFSALEAVQPRVRVLGFLPLTDNMVDLATLPGACMVALGTKIAGVMGNHDGFVDQVRAAADAEGEPVWPLPLPDDLRKQLDSEVADLKNIGTNRYGGALVAGLFLERFVADGIPWAHLDIAGPADAGDDDSEARKGGTGFGVRTLLRLLSDFRKPAGGKAPRP